MSLYKKTLFLLFFFVSQSAVGQSIAFIDSLEIDAQKSKLVYIDVYTDWCGPCKVMAKECFSDPEIAAFLNEHFESYQIDAESEIGRRISRLYPVKGYPTSLFLDKDMNLIQSVLGYKGKVHYLENAQHVVNHYPEFKRSMKDSTQDVNALKKWIFKMDSLQFNNIHLVRRYLNHLPEHSFEEGFNKKLLYTHISYLKPEDSSFAYVMKNLDALFMDTDQIKEYIPNQTNSNQPSDRLLYNQINNMLVGMLDEANETKNEDLYLKYKEYKDALLKQVPGSNKFGLLRSVYRMDIEFYQNLSNRRDKLEQVVLGFSRLLLSQYTPESLLKHNKDTYERVKKTIISQDPDYTFSEENEKILNNVLNEYVSDLETCISFVKDKKTYNELTSFLEKIKV